MYNCLHDEVYVQASSNQFPFLVATVAVNCPGSWPMNNLTLEFVTLDSQGATFSSNPRVAILSRMSHYFPGFLISLFFFLPFFIVPQ